MFTAVARVGPVWWSFKGGGCTVFMAVLLLQGPEVREVHVREVQQGDIAPEDAALQVRAARFEELVLQAEHNAAKRRQLFVEVGGAARLFIQHSL